MNELIKVDADNQTVSARELHQNVGSTERFSAWFERQLQFGFAEGEDYTSVKVLTEVQNNGGVQKRELTDYQISVDMAKHICMVQKNDKAKQVRQYLIELEKAWNTPEQVMARALRIADQTIASLTTTVQEMKPKAEFFDAVAGSKDAVSIQEVAKTLGVKGFGRNNLFEFLRSEKVLDRKNQPYQKYIDMGWFNVIEQHYQRYGEECISFKTLVYQKGVDGIRKMLEKCV